MSDLPWTHRKIWKREKEVNDYPVETKNTDYQGCYCSFTSRSETPPAFCDKHNNPKQKTYTTTVGRSSADSGMFDGGLK